MDIFAAILVVVPLLKPLAVAHGIDPVLDGRSIFIANLELGYLHPPVGDFLFLSAYRLIYGHHYLGHASVSIHPDGHGAVDYG